MSNLESFRKIKMADNELGANITLSNFDLDNQEIIVVKRLVGKYAEKIRYFQDYKELKLEMKTHLKGKNRHFEIKAMVAFGNEIANAEAQGVSPFVLVNEVLEKILSEVKHKTHKK